MVLAPLVLLAVYLGGLWTAALVAAAGGAMGWEWARLCNGGHLGAAGIVSIVTLAALAPAFVLAPEPTAPTVLGVGKSEEHTSELQSLMRSSYAVFCLKKKTSTDTRRNSHPTLR